MRTLSLPLLLLAALMVMGCQQSPQVGRPTVYQFQINPASSENARPVNAQRSNGGGDDAEQRDKLADTLVWRNNRTTIEITTSGGQGAQTQEPTQDVSPETDLDLTP